MNNKIHPTAIVSTSAEIGTGNVIGPFAVIDENVRLGNDNTVMHNAHLTGWTEIGDGNHIGQGAVIGYEPQDLAFKSGIKSWVRIGNRNNIREYVTVHRGTEEGSATEIGDDNYMMVGSHFAHNVKVHNHAIVANCAQLAGYVEVCDRVFISGCVVIHQFCRIGDVAMIGGGAGVGKDVPPYMLVEGRSFVRAINRVGLKRAGMDARDMNDIKKAFKMMYRSHDSIPEALARLRGMSAESRTIRRIVEFCENNKRGICQFKSYNKSRDY